MPMATAPIPVVSAADELSGDELHAWRSLHRTYAWTSKRLDAELEQAHGLPLTSYEVLDQLGDAPDGRMRMCDLAESIGLSRSGLTRLVDRLERDGLLGRCSCVHDARGAYACLTETGRALLEGARETHMAGVRLHFLSRLSAPELRLLGQLSDRVHPISCE